MTFHNDDHYIYIYISNMDVITANLYGHSLNIFFSLKKFVIIK